ALEGGPPERAGRPLEVAGNGHPRWMVATVAGPATARRDRTRRIDRLIHLTQGVLAQVRHRMCRCLDHEMGRRDPLFPRRKLTMIDELCRPSQVVEKPACTFCDRCRCGAVKRAEITR